MHEFTDRGLDHGARLRPLRNEGILVLGSGFMTHSFAVLRQPELAAETGSAVSAIDRMVLGNSTRSVQLS
nr:hypothetical protein [Catenulispora rubra]